MTSHEGITEDRSGIGAKIGSALFKFWHGTTKEEAEEQKFWIATRNVLAIDGRIRDYEWAEEREKELLKLPEAKGKYIQAYGRAWLEDYCRHQGKLPDGRVVAQVPSFGVNPEQLAKLGIEADSFERVNKRLDIDNNYTVILPQGWSLQPSDRLDGEVSPLDNERWAGVYDQDERKILSVYYCHKPMGFGDGFRSYTHAEVEEL